MQVADAQREVRTVSMGGFVGQLVSGLIWLASAGLATWGSHASAVWTVVLGGFFIFPLTMLVLRLMGRPATLSKENPLGGLAMQIAFTIPLSLPLVAGASHSREQWFYPALMIVVGAHYLPFVFLYGMGMFAVLCGLLVTGAILLAHVPDFAVGGWFTGALLVVFAFVGRAMAGRR